ncbi:MAG TPA: ABC transporter permease [Polyangiaceae bacterium]|nr:ABC transporter permease [Polyangiaceae bacterium]
MNPMLTIARREFRSYFDSPLAYVVICLSLLGIGLMFFLYHGGFWQVDKATVQGIFEWAPIGLATLVVPVVTMRLLAEERRSGTLEMLITLPVSDSDVILGKYFGALGLVLVVIASLLVYPIAMFRWPWNLGPLDWGPVTAGLLGLSLYSAASVAIGLLVTALTESQSIAFFVTFFVLASLWFVPEFVASAAGVQANVLEFVSFQTRLEGFERGLIDTRDVVYFLSVTALALAFAFRALERRKWA